MWRVHSLQQVQDYVGWILLSLPYIDRASRMNHVREWINLPKLRKLLWGARTYWYDSEKYVLHLVQFCAANIFSQIMWDSTTTRRNGGMVPHILNVLRFCFASGNLFSFRFNETAERIHTSCMRNHYSTRFRDHLQDSSYWSPWFL